ncbi:hypothetical protein KJY77_05660 [Canibacter sp. lx-72]|uniref:hypothetical protein n=1 Tax=Canibacter zhuwentaonis TaxID=2837491 RepID=UPI001BDC23F2|nr:hypothetical protein [Canibacter zhuwentaonis]MBT1018616.1 hypothetical protein [Canibacter zhuwentaonis]
MDYQKSLINSSRGDHTAQGHVGASSIKQAGQVSRLGSVRRTGKKRQWQLRRLLLFRGRVEC